MINITITSIDSNSKYLKNVIELADKNSEYLGFLPRNVFIEAAKRRNILIALLNETEFVGYLLYRVVSTKCRASITHLCVDEKYRRNGIGRELILHLVDITKNLLGISLYCRRDYESNKFWAHMGFQYRGEKLGRGKDQKPLTYYWYDHNHPSLFKLAGEVAMQSKPFNAVIDANIFIRLFEDSNYPLHADWLLDDLTLCITPELCNEINRDDDDKRRLEMLSYADSFPVIPVEKFNVDQISTLLRPNFPIHMNSQQNSDLMQLSYAIASETDFFVTNDQRLIKNIKKIIYDKFGLLIVSVENLILHIDELINKVAYQVHKLVGSQIQISRLGSEQNDYLADIFHRYSKEKKRELLEKLNILLSQPQSYETFVFRAKDQGPIALIVHAQTNNQSLEIPLMRVIESPLSQTLASQLLFWSVQRAVARNLLLVKITDNNLSNEIKKALQENSFIKHINSWNKFNIIGVHDHNSIKKILHEYETIYIQEKTSLDIIFNQLDESVVNQDIQNSVQVEKYLWPLKISDSNIPSFIVPIQPMWAIDLFDYELGGQTLFGSDESLILKTENIYYRSSHSKLPTAPSRVLWYVSKGNSNYYIGVKAIRACSYVDKISLGTPKDLFRQYQELGVYQWKNVLTTANNNPENNILAFRFSRTQLLQYPIPLEEFMQISGINNAPMAPTKIDNDTFFSLYSKGFIKR